MFIWQLLHPSFLFDGDGAGGGTGTGSGSTGGTGTGSGGEGGTGSGEGTGTGGAGGTGSGSGGEGTGTGTGGSGSGNGGGQGSGSGDDGWTPPSKAEYDNLQRQAREAQQLRDAAATAERERLAAAGEHQKIAEQEKARADAAEAKATQLEQSQRVEKIATTLMYRDPGDVMHLLNDEQRADEVKARKRLTDIAKEKPYLIKDGEKPRTRNQTGDTGGGGSDAEPGGPARMARAYGKT